MALTAGLDDLTAKGLARFSDQELLYSQTQRFYKLLATQTAKLRLGYSSTQINGRQISTEQRLHIRGLLAWWMLATILTFIALTCILACVAPHNVVRRDPSTVGGIALLASTMTTLLPILSRSGRKNSRELQQQLERNQYNTDSDLVFHVSTQSSSRQHSSSSTDEKIVTKTTVDELPNRTGDVDPASNPQSNTTGSIEWWFPWSFWKTTRTAVLFILVAIIVVLEVLYHQSRRHEGLVYVDAKSFIRYT